MAEIAAGKQTLGEARRREADVLYGLVLLFSYGQLALIVWDMLMLLPGVAEVTGMRDPGKVHSFGEMTTAYLGFLGLYIGRNALRKYQGKEDAEALPTYVFLHIQRGYFYLALWGVLSFVAYMLKAMTLIGRMPHELMITTCGVTAALFGDKAIKGFLDKRGVRQMENAAAASDYSDAVMRHLDAHGRITNRECCSITNLSNAQATRILDRLEKEGSIVQRGEGRGGYYVRKGAQ